MLYAGISRSNRARGDWSKNDMIWLVLETNDARNKSNLFSMIVQDSIYFCWPNWFQYIYTTQTRQKNKVLVVKIIRTKFSFFPKSEHQISFHMTIQGDSKPVICSWACSEAIPIILKAKNIKNRAPVVPRFAYFSQTWIFWFTHYKLVLITYSRLLSHLHCFWMV